MPSADLLARARDRVTVGEAAAHLHGVGGDGRLRAAADRRRVRRQERREAVGADEVGLRGDDGVARRELRAAQEGGEVVAEVGRSARGASGGSASQPASAAMQVQWSSPK